MAEKTIAEQLADYACGLKYEDLPDEVVHEVKKRVIDSIACALGAYESPPARAALSTAPEVKGGLKASILGAGYRTTPEHAAFANGVMLRYLDFNDTYLSKEPAHPSDNIPAALACAEASGSNGRDFIRAVVAAYEVQCRLCDAASLRSRGWDHVTYGSFSSAIAASILFKLSSKETVHALGIAGAPSPALRQTRAGELSMWKGCAFANTARNAVFSAMLAKNGMTGPAPIFEGEFGFQQLVSGPFELPLFGGRGGSPFKILETYIKYYPVEYHAQSAVEAAIELRAGMDETDEIESVTVRTFSAAYEIIGSGPEKWSPKTRETADHSLPFCVAAALLDGNITMATFTERITDEDILGLIQKVRIEKDGGLEALYPQAIPNRVEITLKSGRTASREILFPKGHPKNPLTDREVEEKFRALGNWYFSGGMIESVLSSLWKLEEMKDMKELLDLFAKGRRKHGA